MNSRKRCFSVDGRLTLREKRTRFRIFPDWCGQGLPTSENDLNNLVWANLSVSYVFGQMKGPFEILILLSAIVSAVLKLYYERAAIYAAISQRFCCNEGKADASKCP